MHSGGNGKHVVSIACAGVDAKDVGMHLMQNGDVSLMLRHSCITSSSQEMWSIGWPF